MPDEIIQERNYEADAIKQGWSPKENFKGDPNAWVEAKEFVIKGEQLNPILRANNDRLKAELTKTQADMADLRKTAEEFKTFQKESFEKKATDLDKEIKALRAEKALAITAGNGDLVSDIEDRIDGIQEEKIAAKEAANPQPKEDKTSPPVAEAKELVAWREHNEWYMTDARMAAATNAIAETISTSKPFLRGQEFLDELDRELEETFSPTKLGKKEKNRSPVEGGGGSPPKDNKAQSYERLPADAKAACDRFVKQKLMTKEDYVANYDWS